MRIQQTVLAWVVFSCLVALSVPEAWSQTEDPFGSPAVEADPFSGHSVADPFGAPPPKPKLLKATPQELRTKQQPAVQVPDLNSVHVVTVGEKEMDQRIHRTLQDETSNHFVDTPLEEAARVLSEFHHIPMVVDARALEEIGITTDSPVNIALHRVSLRSFLRLMLRDLDLTYMVRDEVLQITTLESAEQSLETRMYRLPELLLTKTDQVLAAFQSAIVPDTWSTAGGLSTANSIDHVLIVSTTSDVHQQVYDFLDTLIHSLSN